MTTHPIKPVRSEKGVALIIVLLLLAVMSGLTTGLTLNGHTEISMASNELYYAGARAAAEAGMNRAVEQIIGPHTVLCRDRGADGPGAADALVGQGSHRPGDGALGDLVPAPT